MRRIAVGLLLALAAFSAAQAPRCLVVQIYDKVDGDRDPNFAIADFLANELDGGGRLEPVVWSVTDPTFRAALQSGTLGEVPDRPNDRAIARVAGALKAEYVLVVRAIRDVRIPDAPTANPEQVHKGSKPVAATPTKIEGPGIRGELRLLRGGREVFKDRRTFPIVTGSAFDQDNTARSMARTWYVEMETKALRNLPVRRKPETPDLAQGQTPPAAPPLPPPPAVDKTKLQAELEPLRKDGKWPDVVERLRDAVEAMPLDADLRLQLIDALRKAGLTEEAAEQAQSAAELMPERIDLRVAAAQAWLAQGDADRAQKELNEAVARDPNAPGVRRMLGEIAFARGEFDAALDHLNAANGRQPTAESRFLASVVLGLKGDATGMRREMVETVRLSNSSPYTATPGGYRMAADAIDRTAGRLGERLRAAIQRASVRRDDRTLSADLGAIGKELEDVRQVLASFNEPAAMKETHARRALSLDLLKQALGDLNDYVKTGVQDSLFDSRINLGEALRQMGAARAALSKAN